MIGLRGIIASAFGHVAVAGWLMTSAVSTPKIEQDMSAAEETTIAVSLDAAEPAQQAEDAPPPAEEQKVETPPAAQVPDAVASLPEPQPLVVLPDQLKPEPVAEAPPPMPEITQPDPTPEPTPVVKQESMPEPTPELAPVVKEQPQKVASLDPKPIREVEKPRPVKAVEKVKPKRVEAKAPPPRKDAGDGKGSSKPKPASAGSSGSKAAGSGGSAESRAYPSMVLARLRGARPSGGGASGRVTLSFTVSASGSLVSAGASGGDAGAKSAALGMVRRAAPFPPIPAGANKSRWSFTVPVQFD